MQYIGSLEAAEKHISAKISKENLHTSVKILQICIVFKIQFNDLWRTLQKNPADVHRFATVENIGKRNAKLQFITQLELFALN